MVKVSLISNAGVLVETDNTRVLIDALWKEAGSYSSIPAAILQAMLNEHEENKWRNVDALLFTHLHRDHFAEETVKKYLQVNNTKRIFFQPQEDVLPTKDLQIWLADRGITHSNFGNHSGITGYQIADDLSITALRSSHMGDHDHEQHWSIHIQAEEKNFLFLADAMFPDKIFHKALGAVKLDAVFANPVHVYSKRLLQTFAANLQCNLLVAYHVPFASEGRQVLRQMVKKRLEYNPGSIPITPLWNPGDKLVW